MFKRKLCALDHPEPDCFNVDDDGKYRATVVWLEDQKIRHRKIEDRVGLRNVQANDWGKHCSKYLSDLKCPYSVKQKKEVMDWLLGYAVRLEYGDDVEKYKAVTPEKLDALKQNGASTNPLDNLDFECAEFKAGVTSLAMLLQIPPHADHLQQLQAICILLQEKFSEEALEAALKSKSKKDEYIPLDKTDLGFEAGDYVLSDAAKILRLIHIKDLRDLQTKINSAIVAVQAVTANPKTDSRLGKVGR